MEPAWTEIPSLGTRSTWHTAQTKRPDVVDCPELSSFPNLQYANFIHLGTTRVSEIFQGTWIENCPWRGSPRDFPVLIN